MIELEELVDQLQSLVNRASQSLGASDDLNPILAVVVDGQTRYRVLDPELFHPSKRDMLYQEALPRLLQQMNPDLAAMVVMLNYYPVSDIKSEENWENFKRALTGKMTAEELSEGVLIAAYSRDEESLWVSEVTRFEDESPLLSLWKELPEEIHSETIEALRKGMFEQQDET